MDCHSERSVTERGNRLLAHSAPKVPHCEKSGNRTDGGRAVKKRGRELVRVAF